MSNAAELWEHVASAALMGTARRPFTPSQGSDTPLEQMLGGIDADDAERALLSAAAILVMHRRAGRTLETTDLPLPAPCDLDDLPSGMTRAAKHLSSILTDNKLQLFLPEWLALAAKLGQRAPEEHLPELLNIGIKQTKQRPAIRAVLGKRGHWLAAQNPDWKYVSLSEVDWPTASLSQRRIILAQLRQTDPDHARALVQSTWSADKAKDRAEFVRLLETDLSMADEPFLETALDDSSKEVNRGAAYLLACLPESRLAARMLERVKAYVQPVKAGLLKSAISGAKLHINIVLPESYTREFDHDGIQEKADETEVGEKGAWLRQMVAAVPLVWWMQTWQTTPDELVRIALGNDHAKALVQGWQYAAQRQKNAEWARALLEAEEDSKKVAALLTVLPPEQREKIILPFLDRNPMWPTQPNARNLLNACDHDWSPRLVRSLVGNLTNRSTNQYYHYMATALSEYVPFMPLSMFDEIIHAVTEAAQTHSLYGHEEFLRLLRFRKSMYEEFNR